MVKPFTPSFCAVCGHPLTDQFPTLNGGPPLVCTHCGMPVYLDPKLAVASVVRVDGRVVLLRRAQHDQAFGKWILPGGHADRGEELVSAARREIAEETGLTAAMQGLLGLYSYTGEPIVLAVYLARAEGELILEKREALEIALFAPDDIPWDDLGYRSTADALRDWLAGR